MSAPELHVRHIQICLECSFWACWGESFVRPASELNIRNNEWREHGTLVAHFCKMMLTRHGFIHVYRTKYWHHRPLCILISNLVILVLLKYIRVLLKKITIGQNLLTVSICNQFNVYKFTVYHEHAQAPSRQCQGENKNNCIIHWVWKAHLMQIKCR